MVQSYNNELCEILYNELKQFEPTLSHNIPSNGMQIDNNINIIIVDDGTMIKIMAPFQRDIITIPISSPTMFQELNKGIQFFREKLKYYPSQNNASRRYQ